MPWTHHDTRQLARKAEAEWRERKKKEAEMEKTHFDNALHVMEVRGGSFIKSLAHCYYMADSENRQKLRDTFAKQFDNYEAQFRAWKAQQEAMTA
jgi:hypothetical protein